MIRCTPVCGPGPVLYCVSVLPLGSLMSKVIVTGLPGATVPAGAKAARWVVWAGATLGAVIGESELDPPQPASPTTSADAATARPASAPAGRARPIAQRPGRPGSAPWSRTPPPAARRSCPGG